MNLRHSLKIREKLSHAWHPRWPRRVSAPASTAPRNLRLPLHLTARLDDLRRRYRRAALIHGASIFIALMSFCLLSQGLADWWFGLPWIARALLFLGDLAVFAWIYRVLIHPPLWVRLNHVDMAQIIERGWPRLNQRLLTAVELAEGNGLSTSGSPQLSALILQDAAKSAARLDLRSVPLRPTVFPAGVAALLVISALVVGRLGGDATGPLLQRIALLNPPRPTKTLVVPITRNLFVAKGDSVTFQTSYRRLHPNERRVDLALANDKSNGYSLDAGETKPGVFSATVSSAQESFRYRFTLNDGRGEEYTVTVKDPPTFAHLELEAIHPEYTQLPPKQLDPAEVRILAGSHLSLRATASTKLHSASIILHNTGDTVHASLDATGTRIEARIPIPARDLEGWSLHLVDEDGVMSRNETVYPIEIIPAKPPKLEWAWPRTKRITLTKRALAHWKLKASDDFSLSSLTIHYRAQPNHEGEATSPVMKERQETISLQPAPADGVFHHRLDFVQQPFVWEVGRTVSYWAEAADGNNVTGPGISKTAPQQIRIVTPEEKTAELHARSRRAAAEVHSLAERHARATAETEEALRRDAPPPLLPEP